MNDLIIEEARSEYVAEIWEMIRTGFEGVHSQYIATGQPGYRDYLSDLILQKSLHDRTFVVIRIQDVIAAFAEVTLKTEGPNFLTRIVVNQHFRGRGIARNLMRMISKVYEVENSWELDVLSSNPNARRMYESYGFKTISRRKWMGRTLPRRFTNNQPEIGACDDPDYIRYGFTNTRLHNHDISVAGRAARCSSINSFLNDQFLTKVQQNYPPVDRAFIIMDASDNRLALVPEVFEIVRSERMKGSF